MYPGLLQMQKSIVCYATLCQVAIAYLACIAVRGMTHKHHKIHHPRSLSQSHVTSGATVTQVLCLVDGHFQSCGAIRYGSHCESQTLGLTLYGGEDCQPQQATQRVS